MFAGIADGVKSLLSESGRVHVDRRSGLALVSDFPERLDRVGLYLETLQSRSARQVRLEARVFEVTLRDAPSIDWGLVRERLGRAAERRRTPVSPPTRWRCATRSPRRETIEDLWAPEVTTMNNEPAMVHISTPGSSSLTMTVVPQISADGIVQLSISHAWDEHDGDRKQGFLKASTPLMRVSGRRHGHAGHGRQHGDDLRAVASEGHRRRPPTGMSGIFGGTQKQKGRAELVVLLTAHGRQGGHVAVAVGSSREQFAVRSLQ